MENPDSQPPENANSGVYTSRFNKWIFFAIGFFGWYLVNGLVWLLLGADIGFSQYFDENLIFFNLLLWPVNLIATIILAVIRKTRMIGFGVLGALVLNILISLVIGIVMDGLCFIPFFVK